MNIDQYLALKAQEEKEQNNPNPEVTPNAQTQQSANGDVSTEQTKDEQVPSVSPEETEPKETTPPETNALPEKIKIGDDELTLEELKNGYLRQSDYTKKTQEAKRQAERAQEAIKFMEQLQQNPQVAQQLSQQFNVPTLDPVQAQYKDLEDRYFDLYITTEVDKLTSKYGDFDVTEVLETARDNNINDLDVAYHVVQARKGGGRQEAQPTVDKDELKAQLREELLAELKAQQDAQVDTSTIIQQGGDTAPVRDTSPQLSAQEVKVAKMMGMKPEDYAKWRDVKKKK